MKQIGEMNQAELAAYVQSHLRSQGIEVVLSGGAAVGIYSNGQYVSKDIDLVNAQFAERGSIEFAMKEIGYHPVGRHFEHPETNHIIEFPHGPLTIGQDRVEDLNEITLETGLLRLLTPTDSVKDRLAHYFHWGDRQCLVQAQLIAANHKIDVEAVRDWALREGKGDAFEEIVESLQ